MGDSPIPTKIPKTKMECFSSSSSQTNIESLIAVTKCVANGANIKQAMEYYPDLNDSGLDQVPLLIKEFVELGKKLGKPAKWPKRASANLSCCHLCQSIMIEPMTLPCGHTFCKSCLMNNKGCSCTTCGYIFTRSELRINIVIMKLLEKWWSTAVRCAQINKQANGLLNTGNNDEAIALLQEAFQLDPSDHSSPCSLSELFLFIGKTNDALDYADITIRLNPTGGKGYFLRASALVKLDSIPEAIVAFLFSLLLKCSVTSVEHELEMLFQRLFKHSFRHLHLDKETDNSADLEIIATTEMRRLNVINQVQWREEREYFQQLLQLYMSELEKVKDIIAEMPVRAPDINEIDKRDLDCPLCLRLIWQPVTSPCGHMFCRKCLDRSLDHSPKCPMCKAELDDYLAERREAITEFVEMAMQKFLTTEVAERQKLYDEEMEEAAKAGKDCTEGVPIFVCTVAMPNMPCPLHIFEPRYRLMTRQCMESGSRHFGMCGLFNEPDKNVATYGTMLTIQEIQFLPDGRSVMQTIGGKRFKVIHLSMKDGYHIGKIEFLTDTPVEINDIPALQELHDQVYSQVKEWLNGLPSAKRNLLFSQYGSLPAVDPGYISNENGTLWVWWLASVLPIDKKEKLSLLGMTSLLRRLKTLHVWLTYILEREQEERKKEIN